MGPTWNTMSEILLERLRSGGGGFVIFGEGGGGGVRGKGGSSEPPEPPLVTGLQLRTLLCPLSVKG